MFEIMMGKDLEDKHEKEMLGTCELPEDTVKQQVSLDCSDKPSSQFVHRILSVAE
jgi:hypothetical protein